MSTSPSFSESFVTEKVSRRTSYVVIAAILFTLACTGLATPFVAILFGYIMLMYLGRIMNKTLAILVFSILVVLLFWLFLHFVGEAWRALPLIAERSVPIVVDFANQHGWALPFSDAETLKIFARDGVREQLQELAKFGVVTGREFIYVIVCLVAACGIFANGRADMGTETYAIRNNAYSATIGHLTERFKMFFVSFHTVMGAQVIISAVNTFFTALFVISLTLFGSPLPYGPLIIVITFLCGILPIVGNLISNTIIFAIALTQSPQLAVAALIFLIVLHKFEYFLNSKIIGGRIKNPMWLTLLGLLVGERLLGIPGMILAPVLLHYIKTEASPIEVR